MANGLPKISALSLNLSFIEAYGDRDSIGSKWHEALQFRKKISKEKKYMPGGTKKRICTYSLEKEWENELRDNSE